MRRSPNLSPTIICREIATLFNDAPFRLRGLDVFVSMGDVAFPILELSSALDEISNRYLKPLVSAQLSRKLQAFPPHAWVCCEGVEMASCGGFRVEMAWRHNHATDQYEIQTRIWYTPTPHNARVPLYHWLGEMAEAA